MSRPSGERVEVLFAGALEQPREQWTAYVAAAVEDSEVRREVLALLLAHEGKGRFDRIADQLRGVRPAADSILVANLLDQLRSALAGHYAVERELGRGGMALVYLAQDLKHDRAVAIKVLRPELAVALGAERFLREIRLAARLQHPHIVPLFDSGRAAGFFYYVMPYVEGEPLRARLDRETQLPLEDALLIAREVADALSYAHRHGVLHRDIKPENILLESGHAIVADFGIARAIAAAGGEKLTETGIALGTPAYMSPEQGAGSQDLDGRSDLYSLGCVLYEMLAGHPPFGGRTAQEVLARHSLDAVPLLTAARPTVPAGIEQAVNRALAKVPADRFRTARQFAEALSQPTALPGRRAAWIAPVSLAALAGGILLILRGPGLLHPPKPGPDPLTSVAVLPFANLTRDSANGYFVDGLTDDLINQLFRFEGLRVPGSATVARYRGRQPDVARMAQELGVSAVVTGKLREASGHLQIALQLVNVADGFVRWSGVYDLRDPRTEADIARAVAESLQVQLRPGRRQAPSRKGTGDVEAYSFYLQGRESVRRVTLKDVQRALSLYQRAISRDSGFADAWTGLAEAYDLLGQLGGLSPSEIQVLTRRATEQAITLDSLNGEAYVMRANQLIKYDWDYARADRDLRRAIELSPGSAASHLAYAQFLNLVGLNDSALAVMRRATVLDNWPFLTTNYAYRLLAVGRLDDATAEAREALHSDSRQWVAHLILARIYAERNQAQQAAAEAEQALRVHGDSAPFVLGPLGYFYGLAGRRGEAQAVLTKLRTLGSQQHVQSVFIAEVRLGLGDHTGALDDLERSARDRDGELAWILGYGEFEELRGDPRYEALLKRIGLPVRKRSRRSTL